jgi:branched-chain amino acid transport system permease protein
VAAARLVPGGEGMNLHLLSGDPPRGKVLSAILALVAILLLVAPFVFPGTRSLAVAERICIFIVLAASYDMLLGYTGIVSFAHTMFFGMGAYGVAIALTRLGAGWGAVLIGTAGGVVLAIVVAVAIGLLSLRVRAIFFAMITLAVASFALILATSLRDLTGGEDGLTFEVPRVLTPAFRLGGAFNGNLVTYYLIFVVSALLFLFLLRAVNSPLGRVLQAIRENEFRAEALGFRTLWYRTLAGAIAAAVAAIAGAMLALQLRYTGPDATLSFSLMIDILLMVVIGGMGTMYGVILGATIMVMAQYYLQPAMGALSEAFAGVPILPALFHPDRWLLWLGILFILIVYFFPAGIVGRLRR